jgi:hypothetical protein
LKTANLASQMKHLLFFENGSMRGGAHALAKASACSLVGTEKARSAFEASTMSLLSKAFWFVLTVATHIPVVSLGKTDHGNKVLGRIDPAECDKSKSVLLGSLPNHRSLTLLVCLMTFALLRLTAR